MTSFEWTEDMAIGDDRIDDQHRKLISLVNAIPELGSGELQETVEYFLRYTFEHFSDEEELMRETGYPDLQRHRELHAGLSARIEEHYANLQRGTLDDVAFRRLAYDWVVDHIRDEDSRFGVYLRSRAA